MMTPSEASFLEATADEAIVDYGACASCTTAGVITWHPPAECERLRDLALAAKRSVTR